MIRALPIALITAAPVAAAETVTFGTSSVTIAPHDRAVAAVTYHNGYSIARATEDATVELEGLRVTVMVTMGVGMTADTFFVVVPEGFIAVPQTGQVKEFEAQTILIFSVEGAGA